MERYDFVAIGGGAAGMTAARTATKTQARVAVIEKEHLGGDCLRYGCVPTKALVASARTSYLIRRAADYGLSAAAHPVDLAKVMARKDAIIREVEQQETPETLRRQNVWVLFGHPRFKDAKTLVMDGEEIRAEKILIATGSRPAVPPIPGLNETGYCTNVELLDLQKLPPRLLVVGGGPIGTELAQIFARLGSTVTVVQSAPRLLPKEDADVSEILAAQFRKEGIEIIFNGKVTRAERSGDEKRLVVEKEGEERVLAGDEILVAIGRAPNIDMLNLEAAGVKYTRSGITVDERLQSSVPGIYAAGDVVGPYLFSHVADEQGRLVGDNVNGKKRKYNERVVPWTTFTDPEVARVGLTEDEARAKYGDKLQVLKLPLTKVDRAITMGETEGFIKILVAPGGIVPGFLRGMTGGEIVGAHIIGPDAGELLHEIVVIMKPRLPSGLIASPMHVYPTLSLGVRQTVGELFGAASGE